MIPTRPLRKWRGLIIPLGMGSVAALVLLTTVSVGSAQNPVPQKNGKTLSPPSAVTDQAALTTPKPKEEPKKSNLDTARTDATELSALADQLRDELNKMNVHILPLDIIQKTEEIEKLARKIKGEAGGR